MHIARVLSTELLAQPGVVPPANGAVLVLGEPLDITFPPDVLVIHRHWAEPVGELKQFDRVLCLAGRHCPNPSETLKQATHLVRPDGLFILVSARPWPWGARGTPWWKGLPLRWWFTRLRQSGWVIIEHHTMGFSRPLWKRLFPWGGLVNVTMAQKRAGGLRVVAPSTPLLLPEALKKPLPGACIR